MIAIANQSLLSNAAWIHEQLAVLTRWLADSGHLWPAERTVIALRAIHAGDERWMERAAEVGL